MKKHSDPRHLKRIQEMQQLFSWETNRSEVYPEITKIIGHLKEIDQKIKSCATAWPIEQINKIDLSILRLSFFELLLIKGTPPKVVVDEAVELAKEYGSESSPSFINGVLGKLIEMEEIKIHA
jgi:transcription antitermination protein NusB